MRRIYVQKKLKGTLTSIFKINVSKSEDLLGQDTVTKFSYTLNLRYGTSQKLILFWNHVKVATPS